MGKINILSFGSGSTGNSVYIEMEDYKFLIDMGIGYRKIRDTLGQYDRSLDDLDAVFLTHGHSDHTKSAIPISKHISCPVYTDRTSMYPIRDICAQRIIVKQYDPFEPAAGLQVTMFPVPHDYVQTCGFIFEGQDTKIGYVTDCGKMNEMILSYLYGSDLVIIESNHDIEMLKHGPYPLQLQKRILSVHGHLSNVDCADTIEQLYEKGTRHFLLAHISLNNNTQEVALKTSMDKMAGKEVDIRALSDCGDDLLTY